MENRIAIRQKNSSKHSASKPDYENNTKTPE
jgi:hypothetical protein